MHLSVLGIDSVIRFSTLRSLAALGDGLGGLRVKDADATEVDLEPDILVGARAKVGSGFGEDHDIADLDGDIDMDVEGDRAMVAIVGAKLTQLVGPNGKVLDALQELTRLAVTQQTGDRSRLMLDVAGHRAARREQLTELGTAACDRAKADGSAVKLEPMTPFERKIVHDAVAAAGLKSESEGDEPNRYVVVVP